MGPAARAELLLQIVGRGRGRGRRGSVAGKVSLPDARLGRPPRGGGTGSVGLIEITKPDASKDRRPGPSGAARFLFRGRVVDNLKPEPALVLKIADPRGGFLEVCLHHLMMWRL